MASRVVIINKGTIEQAGPAKQVYRRPATRFVAEFVGTNNILSGRIERLERGRAMLSTPMGAFSAAINSADGLAVGDAVDYVISADSISLAADGGTPDNYVEGVMVSEQFVGSVVTIYVETATGQELRVQAPQNELTLTDIDPGKPLRLSWTSDSAYLLPSS